MNELIQELSRRRFVLGRETYRWYTVGINGAWVWANALGPIEPRAFERSLIEEEAPQIYEKHLIGKPSAK